MVSERSGSGSGYGWFAVAVFAVICAIGMGENTSVVASSGKMDYTVRANALVAAGLDLARREEFELVAPLPPQQSTPPTTEPTAEPTSTEVRDIDLASSGNAVAWASVIRPQDPPAPVVQSQVAPTVEQAVAAASAPDDDTSIPPPDTDPVAPIAPAAPVMRRVLVGYDRTCVNGQCFSTPRYAMVEDTSGMTDEEYLASEVYSEAVYSEGAYSEGAGVFSRLRENKPVRTFIKNRLSNMRARRCSRLGCG